MRYGYGMALLGVWFLGMGPSRTQPHRLQLSWPAAQPVWYALVFSEDPHYWASVDPGRILIRFAPGYDEHSPAVQALLERHGVQRVVARSRYPQQIPFVVVELPDPSREAALSMIREARSTPGILYAEPEVIRTLLERPSPGMLLQPRTSSTRKGCVPNDPFFWDTTVDAYQWGYLAVYADSAWCFVSGHPAVGVAVIDAGILYTHPDLQANYMGGYDFLDDDPDPYPSDGETHGTHVGGTIAAVLNNGVGVAGFANVGLYSLRVCTAQGCLESAIVNALLTVANTPDIQIANMSLGGGTISMAEWEATDTAWARGKLLFAATGNEAWDTVAYPAGFPGVVAVTAFAWDGGMDGNYFYLAPYANIGPGMGGQSAPYGVELIAPGGDLQTFSNVLGVLSTVFDPNNNFAPGYAYLQGTSMASPHAAGLAALVLARAFQVGNVGISNATLRQVLAETAQDQWILLSPTVGYDPAGYDLYTGFGTIFAPAAIQDPRVAVAERPAPRRTRLRMDWDPSRRVIRFASPPPDGGILRAIDAGGRVRWTGVLAPGQHTLPFPTTLRGVFLLQMTEGSSVYRLKIMAP